MSIDTPQTNKAAVRRFIDEVFLAGSKPAVDALTTEDFTAHTFGPTPIDRDGLKAAIDRIMGSLEDETMRIDDVIAEADLVAVRLTSSARPVKPFMGMEPSGARYEIGEIHLFRVRDGRVSEHWHQADFLGMQRQLTAADAVEGASTV